MSSKVAITAALQDGDGAALYQFEGVPSALRTGFYKWRFDTHLLNALAWLF